MYFRAGVYFLHPTIIFTRLLVTDLKYKLSLLNNLYLFNLYINISY